MNGTELVQAAAKTVWAYCSDRFLAEKSGCKSVCGKDNLRRDGRLGILHNNELLKIDKNKYSKL